MGPCGQTVSYDISRRFKCRTIVCLVAVPVFAAMCWLHNRLLHLSGMISPEVCCHFCNCLYMCPNSVSGFPGPLWPIPENSHLQPSVDEIIGVEQLSVAVAPPVLAGKCLLRSQCNIHWTGMTGGFVSSPDQLYTTRIVPRIIRRCPRPCDRIRLRTSFALSIYITVRDRYILITIIYRCGNTQ